MYVTASLISCMELEGGGGHHRAREPEENKIISLSDGPPLGLGESPFPIEFIFMGIQGGGSSGRGFPRRGEERVRRPPTCPR